jgi:hypothetical protein
MIPFSPSFTFAPTALFLSPAAPVRSLNDPLPSEGSADLVAPFWDDLELTAQSGAHYLADGKQLIVQWSMPRAPAASRTRFN